MGVTRKSSIDLQPIRVEDGENYNYGDYDLSESGDDTDSIHRRNPMARPKCPKKKKLENKRLIASGDYETGGMIVKRNMGSRKWRRLEHARAILTYTDLEDICEDGTDICGQPYTAFDQLFEDERNMQKWHEFVEKDEVEQRRILSKRGGKKEKLQPPSESGWCVLGGKSTPTKKIDSDGRKHHPAYSGKSCYDRLDGKSKSFLLGRKVNWALVQHLEQELRELFCGDSFLQSKAGKEESVFVAHYPSSSDRIIAHIVSKFLWLKSQSVTDPETSDRITEIRNPRSFFIPPHVTLIAHMETILKRTIDFVPFSERIEKNEEDVLTSKMKTLSFSSSDEEWVKADEKSITL